ncbi:MAG: signal peptide peptidase SppA [Proteobacteria bacterium]|nr:signal peptide peptidase SppA [Pseudomonadota bacterium]
MKDLILAIFNIFKYVGKIFTFIRNFLFNVVLLTIFATLIFIFMPKEVSHVPSKSILRLDILGDIVEEKRVFGSVEKLFSDSVGPDATEPETALQDILDIIDNAAADDRIVALLLNLKHMESAGLNQLQTIGQAFVNFRKTGKTIVAAEDYYSQTQYYLASYADKIFLNPMGGVDVHGFGVFRLYFREAMEKLAINYNIFKVGTYKSALEPFTRDNMSPEDRNQNAVWLSALWQVYKDDILKQRKLSKETLENYTANISLALQSTGGDTAQLALTTGLVDQLSNRSEISAYLIALAKSTETKPPIVGSAKYSDSFLPSYNKIGWKGDKIGLIIAEGNILPGKQPPGLIGGDSLAALIKKAREDEQIKALVVRINSGGGSAFASEIIRQELLLLQKKGKPVVVSMGAVAASGGYWIAADADEIWASEATITGSIGIFGAIPTFEKTLSSLGIYSDGTGTTPLAAGLDLTQPLPESLKGAIQQAIAHNYDQFLQIVATGRDLEKKRVGELAEGRVYDGKSALAFGLVDKLGSFDEAIAAAANLAGTTDYSAEYIRPDATVKEQVLQFFAAQIAPLAAILNKNDYPLAKKIKIILENKFNEFILLDDPRGIYAHCLIKLTL